MDSLQSRAEGFKLLYEKFLTACDAFEEKNKWDRDQDGEMEAYYFHDIMCVFIHLISADGVFSPEEADFVNRVFGFEYTPEELAELYRVQGEDIENLLKYIPADYGKLKQLNGDLAEMYKEMLLRACDTVAVSDGSVHKNEQKYIDSLKASLK